MKAANGDVWMATSDGTQYSPSQIAAFIVTYMKEIAGDYTIIENSPLIMVAAHTQSLT